MSSPNQDKLERIFHLQAEFSKRIGLDTSKPLSDEEQQHWIERLSTAISQETAELRDCVQWKWWKKTAYDKQNAKVEVIDLFHFIVQAALVLNLSPSDLLSAYEKKNLINHQRQDSGEAMKIVARNPDDCRTV